MFRYDYLRECGMKIFSFSLLFVFSSLLAAQNQHNFFPTQTGDKYQIKNISKGFNFYPPIIYYPDKYYKYIIADSTVLDGMTFYNLNGYFYYFNLSEHKLYTINNNSVVLAIDFNLSGNQENPVSFNGVNQKCHHSGLYSDIIFGETRNLFTVYYDTTVSYLGVTHIVEKFTFCEGIGYIYHYYMYYRDSDPASTYLIEY